ncbi:patched domain-containing protein 3-like [Centruroides vittatus]|uniref:patched domain-containing protein 3-like n=1 Tax=Centruroides vittatus TaxID=120091 RepID=UPI00350EBB70
MSMCKNRNCNVIYFKLSAIFSRLGYRVAQYPLWFIFVPIVVTIISTTGFFRLELTTDVHYLFFRTDSKIVQAKSLIDTLYPENYTNYDILRSTEYKKYGAVIATAKGAQSMFLNSTFEELDVLDQAIRNMTIQWNGRSLKFVDVCCKINGQCIQNDILKMKSRIVNFKNGNYKIRYPIDMHSKSSKLEISAISLGGVATDEDNVVKDFKAVRLIYFIDDGNYTKYEIASLWEENFLKLTNKLKFEKIKISVLSGNSIKKELNSLTVNNLPSVIISQFIVCSFAVLTCMTTDCVSSKPWIGVAGYLSSILGAATAFGMLLLFGMEYVDMNTLVPLVVLGVGIDDSFVMLSALKKTNAEDDIKKRMADTYSEAAISVTITTLTNVAASFIGLTLPYSVYRIMCVYMAFSFVFSYLYHLLFFGGCLVLSGYRESRNLHAVYCTPVNWNKTSGLMRIITVGISSRRQSISNTKKWNFYRDELGRILSYRITKFIVVIGFVIFTSFGIYFTKFIKYDLVYSNLFHKNSYSISFVEDDFKYFAEYRDRIQVVINSPLDYSNPKVQQQIENLTLDLENVPGMCRYNLTESWLRAFIKFTKNPISWILLREYNMSHPEHFVEAIHDIFFKLNFGKRFKNDIVFDKNKKTIISSRLFVNSKTIDSFGKQIELLNRLHDVIDSSTLNVMIYCYQFLPADSFVNILPYIIQCVCVSCLIVIVIFFLFIPNFHCVICVSFSVVSIVTSTITYASAWGVTMNAPLLLTLSLIAGFSVDYVSHISCAFVCSKADTPEEKMKHALQIAGHPIIQAAGSTILGILSILISPNRIFYDIFKLVFLTSLFASFHALFFLPVLLNIWNNIVLIIRKKKNTTEEQQPSNTSNVISQLLNNTDQISNNT